MDRGLTRPHPFRDEQVCVVVTPFIWWLSVDFTIQGGEFIQVLHCLFRAHQLDSNSLR
jgi:hypothetical protein